MLLYRNVFIIDRYSYYLCPLLHFFNEHKIYLSILILFLENLTVKIQPIEILFNF